MNIVLDCTQYTYWWCTIPRWCTKTMHVIESFLLKEEEKTHQVQTEQHQRKEILLLIRFMDALYLKTIQNTVCTVYSNNLILNNPCCIKWAYLEFALFHSPIYADSWRRLWKFTWSDALPSSILFHFIAICAASGGGCVCVFYIYFCSLQIMIIQHTKLFARYLIRNEQTFQPIGNLILKYLRRY